MIESLFEAECSDCKETYQNTLGSKPLFTCRLCLMGSHDCEQIKQKATNLGLPHPAGYVWICSVCLEKNDLEDMLLSSNPPKLNSANSGSKQTLTDSVDKLNTINEETPGANEESEETEEVEESETEERVSPRRGRDGTDQKKPQKKPDSVKSEPVCELYKMRACPHGRSGKGLVDGNACKKSHPKRCFKFCDFGARHQKGCKKGKKCEYWHPRICKYSLKNTRCENKQCTFQHLVFNRDTAGQENARQSYGRKEETENKHIAFPKLSMTSNAGYTPYPPTISKPLQRKNGDKPEDESFLLQLIENMKAGFQEQINELREEIVGERKNRAPQQMEVQHPVTRAVPGTHPPIPYQYLMAPQWFNQNFPPLSS